MFYLIQANELANSWSRLVAERNQWVSTSSEATQHLEATKAAISFAISEETLSIRNTAGAKLPASALDSELETFISLQDFCDWGSRDGAKLGTPESEFELAYILGIHLLSVENIENSMELKDSHPNLPIVAKQPLRIKQTLPPDNETTRMLRQVAKNEPGLFFTGELEDTALNATPAILIYANYSEADALLSKDINIQKNIKLHGIETTEIAMLLSAANPRQLKEDSFKKQLGNSPLPSWLQTALTTNGIRGKTQRRWNPVLLAVALIDRKKLKIAQAENLFRKNSALQSWLQAWLDIRVHVCDK